MDVLKDFLISTFFEAALAFLWILVLWVASTEGLAFVRTPFVTIYNTLCGWAEWIQDKKAIVPLAVIFVLFSYPLGVVMQRVSDDFIETTSVWMPNELKTNRWLFRTCDFKNFEGLVQQLLGPGDPVWPFISDKVKKKEPEAVVDALNELLKDDRIQVEGDRLRKEVSAAINTNREKLIRTKREFLDRKYADIRGGGDWWRASYKAFGTDEDIKRDVFKKYRHLLDVDIQEARSNEQLNADEEKRQKVLRDTCTRRAFGRESSSAYLNRLLELVRICQTAAMHLFLLFFVLSWLSIFVLLRAIPAERIRAGAFVVSLTVLACWTFWPAPFFHAPSEFNFRVFIMFLLVDSWLLMIGWKIWRQRQPERNRGARDIFLAALVTLALCYFATFSWSEHRENYEEAVLILGDERGQQTK